MLKDFKVLSLFDGIGCFPLAYANVNKEDYRVLEYDSSEIEDYLIDILEDNFKCVNQLGDINKVDWDRHAKLFRTDLITMGTPCTGLSVSGKRDGFDNEESNLFMKAMEVVKVIRPKYVIWENVFGSLTSSKGKDFKTVLKLFNECDYNTVWTTLDMKNFGYPQKRRRVYLIAVRKDLKASKILKSIDPFSFIERIEGKKTQEHIERIKNVYSRHIVRNEKGVDLSYFNRMRSDKFKAEGIAGALLKRDYKSFKDLVAYKDIIRRETPKERLKLQGMPENWFDGQIGKMKDSNLYRANGMSLPVVEYVIECLFEIDNYNNNKFMANNEINYYEDQMDSKLYNQDVNEISDIKFKDKKRTRMFHSGFVIDEGDKLRISGSDKCAEVRPVYSDIDIKTIADIFETEFDFSKYDLTIRSLEGILRREMVSEKNILPSDLKSKILEKINKLKKASN